MGIFGDTLKEGKLLASSYKIWTYLDQVSALFLSEWAQQFRAANGWKQSDSCCAPMPVHMHCKVGVCTVPAVLGFRGQCFRQFSQDAMFCKRSLQEANSSAGHWHWLSWTCQLAWRWMLHHLVDEFAKFKLELFVLNRCLNSNRSPRPFEAPSQADEFLAKFRVLCTYTDGPCSHFSMGCPSWRAWRAWCEWRPLPAPPLSIGETQHRCSGAKHCCSGSISVALAALESKWPFNQGNISSSTAQGGGGSFKNRKPIGEIGCCESGMAKRIHWWAERCLRPPLSLSFSDYLLTYQPIFYLSIYLSICLSVCLSVYLSTCLSVVQCHSV